MAAMRPVVAPGAHLPDRQKLECQGAIARSRQRCSALPQGEALDPALSSPSAGSCLHIKHACADGDGDYGLLEALAVDIEAAGYKQSGDALVPHRSRKHFQIWGDALFGSKAFTKLVTQVLELFDLTLVDCWANLYRHGDDMKSWHHDNYQDRTPRPIVTIGVSLGQARELAFQNALTGAEYRVLQENGDIFAFDEPFNNVFKHSVPAARSSASQGRRISVILWVNEQEQLPRVLRAKRPGQQEVVPLEVDWGRWDTGGFGELSRGARAALAARSRQEPASSGTSGSRVPQEREAAELPSAASARGAQPQSFYKSAKSVGVATEDAQQLIDLLIRVAEPRATAAAAGAAPAGCTSTAKVVSGDDPATRAVSQALTLQGGQQVLAILRGRKLIENRSWRIPAGWYALHSGSQVISDERAERVRQVWPDAPAEESIPHGAILGLFHVHSHRPVEDCRPGYVWARGPICHIISKAIEFKGPIRCRGGRGLWQLEAWQLAKVQEELQQASVNHFDITEATG